MVLARELELLEKEYKRNVLDGAAKGLALEKLDSRRSDLLAQFLQYPIDLVSTGESFDAEM